MHPAVSPPAPFPCYLRGCGPTVCLCLVSHLPLSPHCCLGGAVACARHEVCTAASVLASRHIVIVSDVLDFGVLYHPLQAFRSRFRCTRSRVFCLLLWSAPAADRLLTSSDRPVLLSDDSPRTGLLNRHSQSSTGTTGSGVGVCSMQGRRPYQEDEYALHPHLTADTHLFGLFDGHAGGKCSQYVSGKGISVLCCVVLGLWGCRQRCGEGQNSHAHLWTTQ